MGFEEGRGQCGSRLAPRSELSPPQPHRYQNTSNRKAYRVTITGMIPREHYFPEIPEAIAAILTEESVALFGIAAADQDRAQQDEEYRAWINGGLHGAMGYMERHAAGKFNPSTLLEGCRSLIVVGLNYYQEPPTEATDTPVGRVARYAWGRDYHNALGKRLKRVVRRLAEAYPGHRFRSFVDATPLSERFFAERSGIGFTAKNTLTITSAFGSWFLLGEILSTLEIEPAPSPAGVHGVCPRSCFRCGAACPTGALYEPYRIDARRCISYLTIEHRGMIEVGLRPLMGDWLFGCDLCQEACPLNVRSRVTDFADFTAHRAGARIPLAELLDIRTDEHYRQRFRGTPLLRPGRAAMIRNASIAAANTGAVELTGTLRRLAGDKDPVIREHARWAVDRLSQI